MPTVSDKRLEDDECSPYFRLPRLTRASRARRNVATVAHPAAANPTQPRKTSTTDSSACSEARLTDGLRTDEGPLERDSTDRRHPGAGVAAMAAYRRHEEKKQALKAAYLMRQSSSFATSSAQSQVPHLQPQGMMPMNMLSMPFFNPPFNAGAVQIQAQMGQQQSNGRHTHDRMMQQFPACDPRLPPIHPQLQPQMMQASFNTVAVPNQALQDQKQNLRHEPRPAKRLESVRPEPKRTVQSRGESKVKAWAAADPFWHMAPYSAVAPPMPMVMSMPTPMATMIDPALPTGPPPLQVLKEATVSPCPAPRSRPPVSVPSPGKPNLAASGLIQPSAEYLEARPRRKEQRGRKTFREKLDAVREESLAQKEQERRHASGRKFENPVAVLPGHGLFDSHVAVNGQAQAQEQVQLLAQDHGEPDGRIQAHSSLTTKMAGSGESNICLEGVEVKNEAGDNLGGEGNGSLKIPEHGIVHTKVKLRARSRGSVARILENHFDVLEHWSPGEGPDDDSDGKATAPKRRAKHSAGACRRSVRDGGVSRAKKGKNRGDAAALRSSEDTIPEGTEGAETPSDEEDVKETIKIAVTSGDDQNNEQEAAEDRNGVAEEALESSIDDHGRSSVELGSDST